MSANDPATLQRRRAANRRTVLLLAVVAVAIYAAFLVAGVFGLQGTPS